MRALVLAGHGGLEQLTLRDDLPVPELDGPHAVRLRMSAVALNRLDLFVLAGWPGLTLGADWVPVADGTGVVEFTHYDDMKYALKNLDDTKFRSHEVSENSYY